MSAIDIVGIAARVALEINPVTSLILKATESAIEKSNAVVEKGSIEELKAEAMRQEISLKMAKEQARVSQEIAIARRIDTAEEVTIEEFYDTSGDANVGLKSTGEAVSFGVNGSGKHVTKRVYKFKGWHDIDLENVEI
ncbi:hypothetical protein [Lacrimispora celerecrescens]|uniref:hypothetical protein n=1 Tax=Lacrimispora celerecrescens TaxID=29354 RepID=UPI001647594A|nr:hypothetical protein [Lacrimispora celerecrescens]